MASAASASDVKRRLGESNDAVLVCAYPDAAKCEKLGVNEAMPLPRFQEHLSTLGKKEVIFICA